MRYSVSKNPEYLLVFKDETDEFGIVNSTLYCVKVIASKRKALLKLLNSGDAKAIAAVEAAMKEVV